jgi:hypothetical protein
MTNRFWIASLLFAGCTATVQSAPPPQGPQPPPPPPPEPAVVVATQPAPPPPAPANHPAYLHALSDLRAARGYLARPTNAVVKWDEKRAIREIDEAIAEIKKASIDDGKPLEDHPAVDAGLVWGNRLQKAHELVETARRDVNQEEDNAFASGLKNRAIGHIDNAAHDIEEGMHDAKVVVVVAPPPPPPPPPPPTVGAHPAYLHALGDLRMARALLEKPAKADVKWDEQNGIREIDAAIGEIKGAAIDDGKPVGEHRAIDMKWNHRDRLKNAMELLHNSAHDIEEKEDNAWAKGLRARALGHIRNAEHAVKEATEERKEDRKEEKKEEKREEKKEDKHHGH